MGKVVTDEEIKCALFYIAPLKAPGSDSFHALFFRVSGITLVVQFVVGLKRFSTGKLLTPV